MNEFFCLIPKISVSLNIKEITREDCHDMPAFTNLFLQNKAIDIISQT